MKKFECDCCGLCCRHINKNLLKNFDSGDGVCKFLDREKNLCRIYKNRPDICNVETGYKKYFSGKYSWEEFLKINYEICEELKRKFFKA